MKNRPTNVVYTRVVGFSGNTGFSYLGNNFTRLCLSHILSDSRQFREKVLYVPTILKIETFTQIVTESTGRETKNINLIHKKY